jgi:hypothetical protein
MYLVKLGEWTSDIVCAKAFTNLSDAQTAARISGGTPIKK